MRNNHRLSGCLVVCLWVLFTGLACEQLAGDITNPAADAGNDNDASDSGGHEVDANQLEHDDDAVVGNEDTDDGGMEEVDQSDADPNWRLVWADEFDYEGLPDPQKWSYDVGGHGWGNNESQYYTENRLENARVANGMLTICALCENYDANQYTSARLITTNKGDWKYSKVEVRARLPQGRGTWPAIWMLPTDWVYGDWPNSGEIDVMEHVGYQPNIVHGTVHTGAYNHMNGTQKGANLSVADAISAMHVYSIHWYADRIDFYVDDTHYFTFVNEHKGSAEWPFDQRFHLLLNIAVGGSWGGVQGIDDSVFPATMQVDYVRIYEHKS